MFTDVGKFLMGAGEIRDRLGGISRQRVQQLISRPSFPEPYDSLQMGKVWRIEDVEAWIKATRPELDDTEPAERAPTISPKGKRKAAE
jgi:prophage regulatory protein